jgi:hypothetical protein
MAITVLGQLVLDPSFCPTSRVLTYSTCGTSDSNVALVSVESFNTWLGSTNY